MSCDLSHLPDKDPIRRCWWREYISKTVRSLCGAVSFCVTKGYVCGDRCYVIAMARTAPQQSDGFADVAAFPVFPSAIEVNENALPPSFVKQSVLVCLRSRRLEHLVGESGKAQCSTSLIGKWTGHIGANVDKTRRC